MIHFPTSLRGVLLCCMLVCCTLLPCNQVFAAAPEAADTARLAPSASPEPDDAPPPLHDADAPAEPAYSEPQQQSAPPSPGERELLASAAYAKARDLARKPYAATGGQPAFVREMSEAAWKNVRFNPDQMLWKQEGLPFAVSFYHPGFLYDRGITLHVLQAGRETPVRFSPDMFIYPDEQLAARVREAAPADASGAETETLRFAGFGLHTSLHAMPGQSLAENPLASFLGATFFRGVSKHSLSGVYARGLSLNTALPDGEEYPWFSEFWLIKPQRDDTSLTLYALMDSPSMTGAFRFVLTPGTSTIMDVESRLFAREALPWPQKVGLASMVSMFLFSETAPWPDRDYRPEVHNSDGLQYVDAEGAWFWSPLDNPSRLAVNAFSLASPRGFGLLQRDSAFEHYQDIEARFERRPSLWMEPRGDWGRGRLELIEIPSGEDIHDNIIAFWVPDDGNPLFSDREAAIAYRLYWISPGSTPHGLGRVVSSRMVRPLKGDTVRFVLDFAGGALADLPAGTGLSSEIILPEGATLLNKNLIRNPVSGGWRLDADIRLPRQDNVVQSLLSSRDAASSLRFRAVLKKGENIPDPLTETWVFDLHS